MRTQQDYIDALEKNIKIILRRCDADKKFRITASEEQKIQTVADLRGWLEPLRDEQRIDVNIELLPNLDMSGSSQHPLT